MNKAFSTHNTNGVYLVLSNGVKISTVWGYCNYCENYDKPSKDNHGFGRTDSNDVEVMIMDGLPQKKINYISKKLSGSSGNPFGYININQWLQLLSYCNKHKNK